MDGSRFFLVTSQLLQVAFEISTVGPHCGFREKKGQRTVGTTLANLIYSLQSATAFLNLSLSGRITGKDEQMNSNDPKHFINVTFALNVSAPHV